MSQRNRSRRGAGSGTPTALSPGALASVAVMVLAITGGLILWLRGPSSGPSVVNSVSPPPRERTAEVVDAAGRLLIPIDGGLSQVSLPSRGINEIVPPARSGAVTSAQWSPDGRSAAYGYFHLRAGDSASSSEIFVTDVAGEPRVLVERDRPGTVLEWPTWTPDGRSVLFAYSALEGQRLVRRVERIEIAAGARSQVTNGTMPAVSPDGSSLAVVRGDGGGDTLVLTDSAGGNGRVLIPSGEYTAIGPPRFSPDGSTLAIPLSQPFRTGQESSPAVPFRFLAPATAHAHGDPWEVYLLTLETGNLRRLTRLIEDEISVAWSPDGTQLAVYGPRGLYLVRLDGSATFALDRGGFGGIDWTR